MLHLICECKPRNDQAKPCLAPLRASDFNVVVGFEPTKEMDHQKAMAEFDLALRYLQQDPHGAALLRQAQQSVGKNGERLQVVLTDVDSEYRMLNNLAHELGAKPGHVYPQVQGNLTIVSEHPYCSSCSNVIQQFQTMFPNIKLTLINGVK